MMRHIAWLALLPALGCGGRALSNDTPRETAGANSGGARPIGDDGSPVPAAGAHGDPDSSGAGRPSSGGSDAGGGASAGGASAGGASAGGASAGGAGGGSVITRTLIDEPLRPRGFMSATQYSDGDAATIAYDIQAQFEVTRGRWDGCTRVQLAACWYYECPPGSAPYLPSVPLVDGGALSLATSGVAAKQINVGLLYDFLYEAVAVGQLWSASDQLLTFSGTGSTAGQTPAFALTVQSPPIVTLQTLDGQPAAPVGMSVTRSQGAQVHWSTSGSGVARFTILAFEGKSFAAECDFDASAQSGVMSPEILLRFEPGRNFRVLIRGLSSAHSEVQGWALEGGLAGYGGPLSAFDPAALELR